MAQSSNRARICIARLLATATKPLGSRVLRPAVSSSRSFSKNMARGKRAFASAAVMITAGATASSVAFADAPETNSASESAGASGDLGFKQRVVDNYENRIRAFSSPEKIFAMFASQEKDGEVFMTAEDFVRAIIPHSGTHDPNNPGSGSLNIELNADSIFNLVDSDGDGLLSFREYIFFVTLLSIPERDFRIAFEMFDRDNSGSIDRIEFLNMVEVMMTKTPQGAQMRSSVVANSNATARQKKMGSVQWPGFFGADGTKALDYNTFVRFLSQLQEEMLKLEFQVAGPDSNGLLDSTQFARTLVAHSRPKQSALYFSRIPQLADKFPEHKFSYKDFYMLNRALKDIDYIETAVKTYTSAQGGFNRPDFVRAVRAVAGVRLPKRTVDVVWGLFDIDGDGKLSPEEFLTVLRSRSARGMDRPRDAGMSRLFSCLSDCTKTAK